MSAGWEVGDLALCVLPSMTTPNALEVGRVYTVIDINLEWLDHDLVGLNLAEVVSYGEDWDGWMSDRFRKIKPDAHESCEDEFVTLLKRSKVSA